MSTTNTRGLLGQLLVQREIIAESDLEEALSRQVIHGGRLGSNLIEQGSVSIEAVADTLSYQLGVPAADLQLVMIEESVLATLPAAICDKYKVLPLRLQGGTLHLAMQDPQRRDLIEHLSGALRVRIQPYVVPQLRLLYALERFYGIERPKRYLRARKPVAEQADAPAREAQRNYLAATFPAGDQPAVRPSATSTLKGTDEGGARAQPASNTGAGSKQQRPSDPPAPRSGTEEFQLVYLDDVPRAQLPTQESPRLASSPSAAPVGTQEAVAPLASVDQLVRQLARASDRQSIVTSLVQPVFAQTTLTLLLLPRGELAIALAASGTDLPIEQVCGLVVPLHAPSSIQRAHQQRAAVRCDARQDAIQPMMATYLRAPAPVGACVVPILLSGRVVNLLCVQTSAPINDADVAALERIAKAGATAYDRLIASRRQS